MLSSNRSNSRILVLGCIVLSALSVQGCASISGLSAFEYHPLRISREKVQVASRAQGAIAGLTAGDHQMPLDTPVTAPTAYLEMCERSPVDCATSSDVDLPGIQTRAIAAMVDKAKLAFAFSKKVEEHAPGALLSSFLHWPFGAGEGGSGVAPSTDRVTNRGSQASTASARSDLGNQTAIDTASSGRVASSDYHRLTLDKETKDTLLSVTKLVNRGITPMSDAEQYHVYDYWVAPGVGPKVHGDCEDYALQKRRELISRGVPADSLSLALVRTRYGDEHAVLLVAIDGNDLVLDSRTNDVVAWQDAPYIWLERQAPGDALGWVSLQNLTTMHSTRLN